MHEGEGNYLCPPSHSSSFPVGIVSEDPYRYQNYLEEDVQKAWKHDRYGNWWLEEKPVNTQAFMHTIKGIPRHGLLVDPGAARGLIGIDTRKRHEDETLSHTGLEVTRRKSHATLSGIEGKPRPAHDHCTIPCGIEGDVISFECDTIGGTGRNCPGLLSNDTFIKKKI